MQPHPEEVALFDQLRLLDIPFDLRRHPPVYTVAEAKALRGELDGAHVKNLFLRDKKRRYWLLTVQEDRTIDLKALRASLGAQGSLSFGSGDRLMERLAVIPGAVTPLAAINDAEGLVTVVLDAALRDHARVYVHPNHNAATIGLTPADLVRFLESIAHPPQWLALS